MFRSISVFLSSLRSFGFGIDRVDQFHQTFGGHGFGSFQWQTKSTIPDQWSQCTQSPGNTEKNRVIVHFVHSVVLEQNSGVGVHVGPRVLNFAQFQQNIGNDIVQSGNQFESLIVGQVFQGKFTLASVTGIRFPQHGVAIARNDLSRC